MHTLVDVTAHADGRLVHRSHGALALRQTGERTVHLAGTAAGPLDGDEARVVLRVLAGATLAVRTVAASVVLAGSSRMTWELEVADGAYLELSPEPTVVTEHGVHRNEVHAALHSGAGLVLTERVQLGRAREQPGRWTGLLHVDRDGRPLLRHEVELGPGAVTHDELSAPTALVSRLRCPDLATSGVVGNQVLLALAGGGRLTTELGTTLSRLA